MNDNLETPVVLFIFNRPEETRRILTRIAKVKPNQLYVVADGPRQKNPEDRKKCDRTRNIVEELVDWDCEIRKNFTETNLGLRKRFTTGLEWVFSHCNEAIILEDDCIPSESFFYFCQELLERYRNDERIMDISGTNYLEEWKSDRQDYHFSLYGGIWGWATWRDSWEWYDPSMELWSDPEIRARVMDLIADSNQSGYLKYIYQKVYDNEIETWDYQWGFAKHRNSALSIVPAKNLVSNVGFGDNATNTSTRSSNWENISRYEMEFPIRENRFVAVDREYDQKFHKMRPISQRNLILRYARRIYEQHLT